MNWYEKLVAKQIAKRVRKEIEMNGWKTKASGVGAILSGVALLISGLAGPTFNFDAIQQGALTVIAGLGVLGIGHKLSKLTDAVKTSKHLE